MVRLTGRKIIALGLGLLFALVLLELGLRLVGFYYTTWQKEANLRALARNADYRIVVFGDSMTSGMWPQQLQDVLDERLGEGTAAVIDLAMPGTNSDYVMENLDEALDRFDPHMVVTMMGYNDDFNRIRYGDIPVLEQAEPLRIFRFGRLVRYLVSGEEEPEEPQGPDEVGKRVGVLAPYYPIRRHEGSPGELETLAEAERIVRSGTLLERADYETLLALCTRCANLEEFESALVFCERALPLHGRPQKAHMMLRGLYETLGRLEEIERMYRDSIARLGEQPFLYESLANFYLEQGQIEKAATAARRAEELRLESCPPKMKKNYTTLATSVRDAGAQLVAVQYPTLSVKPLRALLADFPDTLFVENKAAFDDGVAQRGSQHYFIDMFGGSFGHCSDAGNRLIAESVADVIVPAIQAHQTGSN